MRIQLWSSNYDPEPMGIAPLSGVWARSLSQRGHQVTVVAAHPHYPSRAWGLARRPYRERRAGIDVLRLPLWPGHDTVGARLRQEASFSAALAATSPLLPAADVLVAVSPSFPALVPAMVHAHLRRTPWVLWLQDILPDGAMATGLLEDDGLLRVLRGLERRAYRDAARIAVISESFRRNLAAKGVPDDAMARLYNPASRPLRTTVRPEPPRDAPVVLTMGNMGHTQNLVAIVRAFEASSALAARGARLVLTGDGVVADEVRREVRSDRVELTGVLDSDALEQRLLGATVALVSQSHAGVDFNVPSKLMNFMGYGLATVAAVRLDSEVARIVTAAGAGWVVDAQHLETFGDRVAAVLDDADDRRRRERRALAWAHREVSPFALAARWEALLEETVGDRAVDDEATVSAYRRKPKPKRLRPVLTGLPRRLEARA